MCVCVCVCVCCSNILHCVIIMYLFQIIAVCLCFIIVILFTVLQVLVLYWFSKYAICIVRLRVYNMLVNVNAVCTCMYVNKRVELVQRGIALLKMYVLLSVCACVGVYMYARRAYPPPSLSRVCMCLGGGGYVYVYVCARTCVSQCMRSRACDMFAYVMLLTYF